MRTKTPRLSSFLALYGLLVLFLSSTLGAYAQEGTYQLKASREIPLLAAGAAGYRQHLAAQ